ncbi:anti-sigma factor [Pontibacter mangrovi]|uniref:Regulator of SigK n=1 Tax=Pontibacter mangrovi TaxID=2589816 RepID=A0A501W0J1_9BACT|nr:anti-sigma factor [Pontibacter mangrovi]TPE42808.1 anti-sigma factor [Pontibacter mangrovi]
MSNEEYLASGILELYAAGGLTEAERKEVERRAAESPEICAALDEACAAMEAYANLHAIAPRPELKQQILGKLQTHPSLDEGPSWDTTSLPAEETSPYKWMFAASVVLFIISGLLSYRFYTKWQQAEQRLAKAVASEQLMAQNVRHDAQHTQQLEQTLAIMRNSAFRAVALNGVKAHPEASLYVYWNPEEKAVYVDRMQLPAPPSNMQYQLWALDKGTPQDAGLIPTSFEEAGMLKMKTVAAAQAFAITLEPKGGSENPTLDNLMAMGSVEI